MKPQTRTHFTLSLLTAGILCASTATWAANVPAGTQLADKQELVRNNGSEPASLDPHKVESDVEFNIISDLFDGLVSVSPAGEIQPRLAEKWENKDNTVWTFHLRPGITERWNPHHRGRYCLELAAAGRPENRLSVCQLSR